VGKKKAAEHCSSDRCRHNTHHCDGIHWVDNSEEKHMVDFVVVRPVNNANGYWATKTENLT
jgi:ribulose bisphosphate carboxylase small subunit